MTIKCKYFIIIITEVQYETSDVDLLISSDVKGLKFYGMVEKLRTALHKKVDVLSLEQLKDNLELTSEILKDGIRIYG